MDFLVEGTNTFGLRYWANRSEVPAGYGSPTNAGYTGPEDLERLWKLAAPPAVGTKLPDWRPSYPWQVGLRCSPSQGKEGALVLTSLLLTIHRELLGDSTSFIPGKPQVLIRELVSELCSHSNSSGRGDWGGRAGAVTAAFRYSRKLHPVCSLKIKMVKGPKTTSLGNT